MSVDNLIHDNKILNYLHIGPSTARMLITTYSGQMSSKIDCFTLPTSLEALNDMQFIQFLETSNDYGLNNDINLESVPLPNGYMSLPSNENVEFKLVSQFLITNGDLDIVPFMPLNRVPHINSIPAINDERHSQDTLKTIPIFETRTINVNETYNRFTQL